MSSKSDARARHPFFRVMVLMGGSLAIGCGGRISEGESTSPSAGGGSSSGGSTSPRGSTGGGDPGLGGSATSATGGNGITIIVEPIDPPLPAPVDPGPFACDPQIWDCPRSPNQCADGLGWSLPSTCTCDASRPRSPADCGPGETFVCRVGTTTEDGRQLTRRVPFNCSCAPKAADCSDTCRQAFSGYDVRCLDPKDPSSRAIVCGCALTYLQ